FANVLGIAGHGVAAFLGDLELGFTLLLVRLGMRLGGFLHLLGVGLRGLVGGLGVLLADVLVVARQAVAAFLRRLVVRLRLFHGSLVLGVGDLLGFLGNFVGGRDVAQRQADDDGGGRRQQAIAPDFAGASHVVHVP